MNKAELIEAIEAKGLKALTLNTEATNAQLEHDLDLLSVEDKSDEVSSLEEALAKSKDEVSALEEQVLELNEKLSSSEGVIKAIGAENIVDIDGKKYQVIFGTKTELGTFTKEDIAKNVAHGEETICEYLLSIESPALKAL